jgi:hypothetical protein
MRGGGLGVRACAEVAGGDDAAVVVADRVGDVEVGAAQRARDAAGAEGAIGGAVRAQAGDPRAVRVVADRQQRAIRAVEQPRDVDAVGESRDAPGAEGRKRRTLRVERDDA